MWGPSSHSGMKSCVVLVAVLLCSSFAFAGSANGLYAGLGLYAQNSFDKTTKTDDGSGSLLGAYSFPLIARYNITFSDRWTFAPALCFTPLPRDSGGGTAKTTFIHLSLPFVYRMNGGGRDLEFYAGPGVSQYQIKGAGGTKTLNNGTTTATFAVPGGDSTSKLVTADLGFALDEDPHRMSVDFFIDGAGSPGKRSINLLLSYMYHFGGGF